MTRSQMAFVRGVRGKVLTTRSPLALNTSSNAAVKIGSRSWITNRSLPMRSARSMARLRVCCTAHAPVGCAVTPAKWSLRVPCSVNTSTYNRWSSTVSTTRKSHAMIAWAWAVRNCRHVGPARRGAGSMPAAWRISQTVDAAIVYPSRASSPWMRLCPQVGFSRAIPTISVLIETPVGGRPGRRGSV